MRWLTEEIVQNGMVSELSWLWTCELINDTSNNARVDNLQQAVVAQLTGEDFGEDIESGDEVWIDTISLSKLSLLLSFDFK